MSIRSKLIQIKPQNSIDPERDTLRWSRVHPRFDKHDGCIVDLGCLGWNEDFNKRTSQSWSGYFFGKKRVIGVDPQEVPNPQGELFSGFVHNFSGRANLVSTGVGASIQKDDNGVYETLTWKDFKARYNITSISILKINIEGSEWDLLDSFQPEDFDDIDQICVSFHDWLPQFHANGPKRTAAAITKICDAGFEMTDLGLWGWKHFLKK